MDRLSDESESRFAAYVGGLFGAIGHVDRTLPLRDYCLGLLLPGARKSVEPMAALTAPGRVPAQHQLSQRCADASLSPSPGDSSDVRAAISREGRRKSSGVSDTVRLEPREEPSADDAVSDNSGLPASVGKRCMAA